MRMRKIKRDRRNRRKEKRLEKEKKRLEREKEENKKMSEMMRLEDKVKQKRGYKREYYSDGFKVHADDSDESRLIDILFECVRMSLYDDYASIDAIVSGPYIEGYLGSRPDQLSLGMTMMDNYYIDDDRLARMRDEINYSEKLYALWLDGDERMIELMKYIHDTLMNAIKVVEEDTSINPSTEDSIESGVFSRLLIGEVAKTLKAYESGVEREKLIIDIHNTVMDAIRDEIGDEEV